MHRIPVIDSHTGGEPTRVVLSGFPDLGPGPLQAQRERLITEHDHWRRATVCEPRSSEVVVGALLVPPVDPSSAAAVIFFNNAGTIGMCGHGTIGVVETLRFLGRIGPGVHRIETPVGRVTATLHEDRTVSVENVVSYRCRSNVSLDVPEVGRIVVRCIEKLFRSNACILLMNASGKLEPIRDVFFNRNPNEKDLALATWSFNNKKKAGWSTDTLNDSAWLCLPLEGRRQSLGVLLFSPTSS